MKKAKYKHSILEYYDYESSDTLEFRRLARNIISYKNSPEVKSILVTSAAKHEGKSLISANLAITIAKREEEKRVLLIDCDLCRPTIHSLFNIKRQSGMWLLLEGKAELSDVIHDTELENLKIIPSGKIVESPTQLLKGIRDALDKCKESFDIVICDSPPVVPADEASIIAPCVDGVLLVVMAGKTDRVIVKRAIEILDNVNAKILGVALNNLHKTLPYYYNYSYYRYGYDKKDNNDSE
jgi:protein-tyrosine kinase